VGFDELMAKQVVGKEEDGEFSGVVEGAEKGWIRGRGNG
jgi:hypothetical protein